MKSLKHYILERLHHSFGMQFHGILEMAQVNTYDNDGAFNHNKIKVQVYGGTSEHNPPHVHLVSKDNSFDIRVRIEDGEYISAKRVSKRTNIDDLVSDFKKWLDKYSNNPSFKNKTNKDMCIAAWNLNNPDKLIDIL